MHLPLSIADADGTLKKTPKSQLLHKIEGTVEPVQCINEDHTFIVDGMAYVRQLKVNDLTYKEFATRLLKYIVSCARSATRIDVVFDVYKENSIKDVERLRRSSGELVVKKIVATSSIKQWNQLLSSGDLKNKLVDFFVTEWKRDQSAIGDKTIFVTNNRFAYKLTTDSYQMVEELESDHEEADTRMLLHAKHASLTHERIISTPDNDVFVIALAKLADIEARLYMLTGTKDKRRIIDLNAVSEEAFQPIQQNKKYKESLYVCITWLSCLYWL